MTDQAKIYDRQSADLPIGTVAVPAIVDDPLEHGAKLRVLRNVRDDPLAGMHARGQIDDAMLAAGRKWQMLREQSQIGTISAIDPTREAVDGGRMCDPISDRQIKASDDLDRAKKALGLSGNELIEDVLGRRSSITDAAIRRGLESQAGITYVGRRFRGCLDILAVHFGLAQSKWQLRG